MVRLERCQQRWTCDRECSNETANFTIYYEDGMLTNISLRDVIVSCRHRHGEKLCLVDVSGKK